MKRSLIALAAIAALATTASEASASVICGASVHAGVAMSGLDVEANGIGVADINAQGLSGGLGVGCDYKIPNSAVIVGMFGDYTWHRSDFDLMGFEVFDIKSQWAVGGRLGVYVLDPVLVYALVGYSELELDGKNGIDVDPDFGGWVYGAGIEIGSAIEGVTVGAEYRMSEYKSEVEGFASIDPTVHTVMLTAKYKMQVLP